MCPDPKDGVAYFAVGGAAKETKFVLIIFEFESMFSN